MSDSDSTQPMSDSRERAAFHVSIHSATDAGRVIWETRAYHEESDTAIAWPGPPGEALVQWLCAVAGLPREVAAHEAAEQPQGPGPEAQVAAAAPAAEPPAHDSPGGGSQDTAAEPVDDKQPGGGSQGATAEPVDDFTQIIGISAATERQLHAAGIRTYAELAERSAAELGALLALPPERISRRGWITRARALARLASLPITQAVPSPAEAPPPEQAATALWVEVLFDEEGAILEQRLLREGEPPAPQPAPEEARAARFFVEAPPAVPGAAPIELHCELSGLELEEIPAASPGGVPRLRARSALRVTGLGGAQARREGAGYLVYVLAHELETGATSVLYGTSNRLSPDEDEDPISVEFELPEIGRYQMLLAVLLADGVALSAVAGPRLRVNP